MSYSDSYSRNVEIDGRHGRQIFVPGDMEEKFFLGTHKGDEPIQLSCGRCGYSGPSQVRKEKGPANVVASVVTLGFAKKKGMETHHACPGCNRDVAYSKPL